MKKRIRQESGEAGGRPFYILGSHISPVGGAMPARGWALGGRSCRFRRRSLAGVPGSPSLLSLSCSCPVPHDPGTLQGSLVLAS